MNDKTIQPDAPDIKEIGKEIGLATSGIYCIRLLIAFNAEKQFDDAESIEMVRTGLQDALYVLCKHHDSLLDQIIADIRESLRRD